MQVRKRLGRAAVVLGVVAAGLVATSAPSFAATDPITTVTPAHGPSGGGNVISLTPTTSSKFSGATGPVAQFSATACADPYDAPVPIASSAGTVTAGIVQATTVAVSGNNLNVTVPSSLNLPPDVTAPVGFYVCVYDGSTVGTTALLASTATAAYTVNPMLVASPSSGASGGSYNVDLITANAAFTPYSSSYTVQFQAKTTAGSVCAATPPSASAPSASNASTITGGVIQVPVANVQVPSSRTMKVNMPATMIQPYLTTLPTVMSTDFNVCVYASNALVAETLTSGAFNLSGNVALSAATGSSAGGNSITLTAYAPIFTSGQTFVQFQSTTTAPGQCDQFPQSSGAVTPNVSAIRFISTSKIAVTVPAIAANSYKVCVYDSSNASSGNHLVAQGYSTYVSGNIPAIVSVLPATGPAQGGSTIVVTGTNLPSSLGTMTAAIGGTPMSITAQTSSSFTAVTPPHAPGTGFDITITLTNGTTYTGKSLFTFTNGITVTPNTAPNSKATGTDLDIQGVGFQDLSFAAPGVYDQLSTKAHVYLVKGTYDPKGSGTTKTVGPTAECADVLVVSDTNLICTLYTMGNGPLAATTARSVQGCTGSNAGTTLTPGGACTFSATDVGLTVLGTGIPAATTITAVNAGTGVATISKAMTAPVTGTTVVNVYSGTAVKALTDAAGANNTKALSTTTAMFAATDVGKAVSGANIPAGTVITAFTDTKNVTLSNNLSGAQTASGSLAQPIYVYGTGAIPNGTYTVTVVSSGAVNANVVSATNPNAANYMQSILSSGSTFTVADYN
ncbi:IPT/TIG domain-containing protein [Dactylosporangium sp. NPDC051541]|uniref:IPT/TIG domain-containing protein n=1 Tax=Dactylosporangium sp. NPDC051541 TaxID=3363977 RepID=UPI0037B94D42